MAVNHSATSHGSYSTLWLKARIRVRHVSRIACLDSHRAIQSIFASGDWTCSTARFTYLMLRIEFRPSGYKNWGKTLFC